MVRIKDESIRIHYADSFASSPTHTHFSVSVAVLLVFPIELVHSFSLCAIVFRPWLLYSSTTWYLLVLGYFMNAAMNTNLKTVRQRITKKKCTNIFPRPRYALRQTQFSALFLFSPLSLLLLLFLLFEYDSNLCCLVFRVVASFYNFHMCVCEIMWVKPYMR